MIIKVLKTLVLSFSLLSLPLQAAPIYTFKDVMDMAVSNSPSIRVKEQEFEAAEQGVNGARWGRYPSLTMSLGSKAQYSGNTSSGGSGAVQGTPGPTSLLRLQQPLYTWGAISSKIGLSQGQREVARLAVISETNVVLEKVITGFGQLQSSQERQQIIKASITRLQEFEAMMRRRFDAQVGSRNDVTTVTARLLQSQNDLTQAQMQEQKAQAFLQELTGQAITKVKPEDILSPLGGKNADAFQIEALDASSEFASAKAQLDVAQRMTEQKKAAIMPALVARLEGLRYQSIGNPTVTYGQGYLALEGTFGNGLSQIADVRGQAARVEGAEQQIEVTRRSVIQSLEAAVADSKSYSQQLKSAGEVVNQNQSIVDSYLRLYLAGKKTWFEVLSAERELTQSRISLADMKASAASSNNRVLRILGKLLYLPIESQ